MCWRKVKDCCRSELERASKNWRLHTRARAALRLRAELLMTKIRARIANDLKTKHAGTLVLTIPLVFGRLCVAAALPSPALACPRASEEWRALIVLHNLW